MTDNKQAHIAYAVPYNEISEATSEDILDMFVSGKIFLISESLPYAEHPYINLN